LILTIDAEAVSTQGVVSLDQTQQNRSVFSQPSSVALIALGVLSIGFWWSSASMMRGMSAMPMAGDTMSADWSFGTILGTALMWLIMMIAMMLPASAPVIATYTKLSAKEASGTALASRAGMFGIGYLGVWGAIAVILGMLQLLLRESNFFTMMGTKATPLAAGILLVIAGAWQLTAIKDFCLQHCRHPVTFLIGHWRDGAVGALRMGVHHGLYCVGCCIALMGLMFVFGAMSLFWMAVIAAYFLAEKTLPRAEIWGRWIGIGLIAAGLFVTIRATL